MRAAIQGRSDSQENQKTYNQKHPMTAAYERQDSDDGFRQRSWLIIISFAQSDPFSDDTISYERIGGCEPHAEPPAGGSACITAEYSSTVMSVQIAAYAAMLLDEKETRGTSMPVGNRTPKGIEAHKFHLD